MATKTLAGGKYIWLGSSGDDLSRDGRGAALLREADRAGRLMQVVNAFSFVQNSPSFIINSYNDIAVWQAVTQRLSGFEQQVPQSIHQSVHRARS